MLKNSAWRLVTQLITMFFSLISSIIINRILGPENKGHYAVVNLTVTMIFICGYLGLNQAITYHRAQKTYQDHYLRTFLVFFGIVWGIVLGMIGLVMVNFLSQDILGLAHTDRLFLSFGLFFIFTRLLNAYLIAYILGGKQFTAFNIVGIFNSILNVALLLFIIFIDDTLTAIYLAWLLNPFVMSILLIWITREQWSLKEISFRTTFKDLFSYGYKAYITNFMQFFNYRLDQYVLNYYRSPIEVGIYTVAVGLGGYIWQISNAVQTIMMPSIASGSREDAKHITSRANRNTLFLSAICACLLAISGYCLITTLYGSEYVDAYPALLWLLPGIVAFSVVKVLTSSLAGLGHPEAASIVTGFAMIFTLLLDFVWIPNQGILGAAQASTIAYSSAGLLSIVIYLHHVKVPLKQLLFLQAEDLHIYMNAIRSAGKAIVKRGIQ